MLDNALALVAATAVLVMIPGPNVALIVANSLQRGYRYGLITVVGTTLGIGLQLLFVIIGFALLIEMAATALSWIRWLGVAYLVFLGIGTWIGPVQDLDSVQASSDNRAFLSGVGMALVNPKTLLFNAAFLPQFVDQSAHVTAQLAILSAVFLITVAIGDSLWVLFAGSSRSWLAKIGRVRNKLAGGFLIGAGIGLALARRSL